MSHFLAPCLLILLCSAPRVFAQDATQEPTPVSSDAVKSLLIRRVPPLYPPLARQARIQGTVVLRIVINKSGEVRDLQLFSGHPMLAPAAIEAVKQWRYQPYLKDGEPVEVETTVQVNFKLTEKPLANEGAVGAVPPASPRVSLPQRVRVSSGVSQGLLRSKVIPQYPPDAREQHIQGTVLLQVNIDKEGNVYKVELISGIDQLAPAAMEAVRQWKYQPYLLNGNPVEIETQVQVNFTLAK